MNQDNAPGGTVTSVASLSNRPAAATGSARVLLPEAAKEAFKDFFINVSQNPTVAQRESFAKQFKLKNANSVRGWFIREKKKQLKAIQPSAHTSLQGMGAASSTSPVVQTMQEDIDEDEEAAKKAFGYLKEEHIIRLHTYFKDRRLNKKYVSQLASQFGVPEPVVVEFAKWMAQREMEPSSADTTPQSSVPPPHLHSKSPIGSPPHSAGSTSYDPIKMEVDDEDDEAAASLPTPQRSVEPLADHPLTTPRALSPEPNLMTFYDTWIQSRPTPLMTASTASSDGSPSAILDRHLPLSLTQFAFGSSNSV